MNNEISAPEKEEGFVPNLIRIAIMVIQLTLVYCFSGDFQPFFYQAF